MLLHGSDESSDFFHFFVNPEKLLLQDSGRDRVVPLLQFIEQFAQLDSGLFDEEVEFTSLAALALSAFLRLIPQGWLNAHADIVFHSCTVYCDAHTYGGFSVFQQFGFLDEEKHIE